MRAIPSSEDKGLTRAPASKGFQTRSHGRGLQASCSHWKPYLWEQSSGRVRFMCYKGAVFFSSSDWSSWDGRKLLATVLKTADKGFDLLIKFLLSAFDISAKLYPLQEQQESLSLQRGAHSVTCNYGIYCGAKRCLGRTCRPSAPTLPLNNSPLSGQVSSRPRLPARAQGRGLEEPRRAVPRPGRPHLSLGRAGLSPAAAAAPPAPPRPHALCRASLATWKNGPSCPLSS